jgi:hypothetical protein
MNGSPGSHAMPPLHPSAPRRRLTGFNPFRLLRRIVVFGFAVIQLVLVLRILIDLGVIPAEGGVSALLIGWSDRVAAPVQRAGSGLGGLFGGDGLGALGGLFGLGGIPGGAILGAPAGQGFNLVMVTALAGWSVVEALVMRVVRKFEAV